MATGYTETFTNKRKAERWIKKMQRIPKYPEKVLEKSGKEYIASVWN